jgi:hypothetical protein
MAAYGALAPPFLFKARLKQIEAIFLVLANHSFEFRLTGVHSLLLSF